ncbi:hypothetical protein N431DRAFT_461323 [Stipitochalara longipes BDJ]|nr:hypothetical protein N431DRAFT_461323 [Stipitochalara longipes BDJ]
MTSNQDDASLLSQVISSHGGQETWSKFHASTFKFNFSGAVLAIKGLPNQYQVTVRVSTNITTPRTEIQGLDLEHPTDTWVFTHERVWTQDPDGTIKQSRTSPREGFQGRELQSKWDQLNLAYFAGYALWKYTTFPFALAGLGFETKEVEEHWEPGYLNSNGLAESWRVLEVRFPENYDAHTRVQKMYFDREKLWVRRMDYVAEVAGGIAAHYCFDHKLVKGIVFPMLRRVVSRIPGTDTALVSERTGFLLNYFDVDFAEKMEVGSTEGK